MALIRSNISYGWRLITASSLMKSVADATLLIRSSVLDALFKLNPFHMFYLIVSLLCRSGLQNSVSFGPTLHSRAGRPISWAEKRRV
ncbi:hypothetical protein LINPERHAP1_LOCUS36590 [Linum perenne]